MYDYLRSTNCYYYICMHAQRAPTNLRETRGTRSGQSALEKEVDCVSPSKTLHAVMLQGRTSEYMYFMSRYVQCIYIAALFLEQDMCSRDAIVICTIVMPCTCSSNLLFHVANLQLRSNTLLPHSHDAEAEAEAEPLSIMECHNRITRLSFYWQDHRLSSYPIFSSATSKIVCLVILHMYLFHSYAVSIALWQ